MCLRGLRCAAACATFAALHYTGFSAPRHIRFNSLSPCPPPLANPLLLVPHVAALSAARQCCCAKHNLALHTFERLFLEKLNYEHTTNVKKHGKTKQPSCVCSTASIPCNEQQLLSRMIPFFLEAVSVCQYSIILGAEKSRERVSTIKKG